MEQDLIGARSEVLPETGCALVNISDGGSAGEPVPGDQTGGLAKEPARFRNVALAKFQST
ncbi:hypothetical protein ACFQGS_00095 [Novosphingobium lubricantis]|jgi:hypothetical protein